MRLARQRQQWTDIGARASDKGFTNVGKDIPAVPVPSAVQVVDGHELVEKVKRTKVVTYDHLGNHIEKSHQSTLSTLIYSFEITFQWIRTRKE